MNPGSAHVRRAAFSAVDPTHPLVALGGLEPPVFCMSRRRSAIEPERLVGPVRLELTTSAFAGRRAIHLRHGSCPTSSLIRTVRPFHGAGFRGACYGLHQAVGLVLPGGLEPPASVLSGRRSNLTELQKLVAAGYVAGPGGAYSVVLRWRRLSESNRLRCFAGSRHRPMTTNVVGAPGEARTPDLSPTEGARYHCATRALYPAWGLNPYTSTHRPVGVGHRAGRDRWTRTTPVGL